MEQSKTATDYKCKFDTLTSEFLHTYITLECTMNQVKKDLSNQLLSNNNENKKLSELLVQKDNTILELEETVAALEKKMKETPSLPVETSENKFDIIRGQAKEIAAKDKEIIRLTGELVKLKESLQSKPSEGHGWSPTSCPTPVPKDTIDNLNLEDSTNGTESAETVEETVTEKTNPSVDSTDENSANENSANENKGEDGSSEEEEYHEITYRKVNYYLDSKQKVYEIITDEDGYEDVGDCVGDWKEYKPGKFKVVKH